MCLICNVVGGREGCEGCPGLHPSVSSSFTRLSNIFLSGDNGDDVVGLVSMEIESIRWEMVMGGESCIAATGVDGARSILPEDFRMKSEVSLRFRFIFFQQ